MSKCGIYTCKKESFRVYVCVCGRVCVCVWGGVTSNTVYSSNTNNLIESPLVPIHISIINQRVKLFNNLQRNDVTCTKHMMIT